MFTPDGSPAPAALPVLPYGTNPPSSGWAGSVTSRDRALRQDADGTTTERQERVLALLRERGEDGATWREAAQVTGTHHGQVTSALSGLHKAGRIARLATEKRDRCAVYVLPAYAMDRPVAAHGRTENVKDAEIDALKRLLAEVTNVATKGLPFPPALRHAIHRALGG